MVEKKASIDEIKSLNAAIEKMVKSSKEKSEDMSDKLDLLRRVEIKFYQLVEWRKQYTERGPAQAKDVAEKEKSLKGERQKER